MPLAGLEPAQAAYLALTGYKTAALTIELQGQEKSSRARIRLFRWHILIDIVFFGGSLAWHFRHANDI